MSLMARPSLALLLRQAAQALRPARAPSRGQELPLHGVEFGGRGRGVEEAPGLVRCVAQPRQDVVP